MKTSSDNKQSGSIRQRTPIAGRISRAAIATLAIPIALPIFSACSSSFSKPSVSSSSVHTADRSAEAQSTEKVDLRGVEFRRDGSLRPMSRPVLDDAAELIKNQPDAKVYVDAYDDPSGGAKLNQRLSDERAKAVKAYLIEDGIAPDRVVARGFGASHFVASNAAPSGRLQNRRIELVIVHG
jgi:outer membrane protein OmpA-like peptidoglycan-associated protein